MTEPKLESIHIIRPDLVDRENVWYCQIPLQILSDPNLTKADLFIYGALDFLAGKRGYHYISQESIIDAIEDKLAGTHQLANIRISRKTISRSVNRLRRKDYIRTEPMGLRMNHILRYFVMARSPANPPSRSSQKQGLN